MMGKSKLSVLSVLVLMCLAHTSGLFSCSKIMQKPRGRFHLIAPCGASGMTILARANTTSLKRCSRFANLKQGMAFNFKSPGKKKTTTENCLVYDCPESNVLQSLRRERGFDYYSLYADPLPLEDSICLVGVGIFRLHEKAANYTEALKNCKDEGGELASVLSAKRTNGLANIVSGLKYVKKAYVGLNDMESEGKFVTPSGNLVNCYEFRAWGPGEPKRGRRKEKCVVIDAERNWKVVNCSKKLPFICELLPKGPFPVPDEKVADACSIDLSNRKYFRKILCASASGSDQNVLNQFSQGP